MQDEVAKGKLLRQLNGATMEKAKIKTHIEPFEVEDSMKYVWVMFLNNVFIYKCPLLVEAEEEYQVVEKDKLSANQRWDIMK